MYANFFRHINIDPANVHILDGNAPDLELECSNFEKKITESGGIQLFIGGTVYRIIQFVYKKNVR